MRKLLALLAMFAVAALGADISGKWKGTAEGPNGPIERTFTFKVDGTKLTGETESQMIGKSTIQDGKVEGEDISFSINANFQGNDIKLDYRGKIVGDQIRLTVEFPGGGQTAEYTLKRES
ncbi:MAG TPA: hypothetical protein VHB50_22985 [Bryobacteraceae bacterium]|nr:hypothetical protein [Bryobacteraceae bacterium]